MLQQRRQSGRHWQREERDPEVLADERRKRRHGEVE